LVLYLLRQLRDLMRQFRVVGDLRDFGSASAETASGVSGSDRIQAQNTNGY
jgi:hypothetical protein